MTHMGKERAQPPTDDAGIEELLRQVGARDEPAADVMSEVQREVHAEWRAMLAERSRRRRTLAYGVAASVVFAAIIVVTTLRFMTPAEGVVATIALVDGQPQVDPRDGASHALHVGDGVIAGATLHTDASSRLALDVSEGVAVRIDRDSIVQVAAIDRLILSAGAVYVDADPGRRGRDALVIETRAGDVRHVGTQYQVRQTTRAVEVSIREGRIAIVNVQGDAFASAGEQLRILGDGSIERSAIAANDPRWQWAAQAAPLFEIDNQTLAAFLDWVARETGRTIVYATPQAQLTAEAVRLHGSIAGLDPDAALAAVLSTTELRRYQTQDDVIGIVFGAMDSKTTDSPTR
jgi:ferric-dicitrate binding protein FerR (iron transport regulator)